MSSATVVEADAGRSVIAGTGGQIIPDDAMEKIRRLGMTPRQQLLNWLWSWYKCAHYEPCKFNWDGSEHADALDHEAIATGQQIPPGFVDAGAQTMPLKFRRPSAPYNLCKVIVDRFTGLLFSERHHPQIRVEGDPETEEYVRALAEAARLWAAMIQARAFGGGQGTVAIGFKFIDGKPLIEIHDARWTHAEWADRTTLTLKGIEKRYQYPREIKDPKTGLYVEVKFWYRRIITDQQDILFKPAIVTEEEPHWEVEDAVTHGLGFCPVVWVQNLPVVDDVDGDPDCQGIFEIMEGMDQLIAQAHKGTLANCDPTLMVETNADLPEVKKGSSWTLKVPVGGSAGYMEMTGSGSKAALEMVDKLRAFALEVAQCVLEHPQMANRTATEIDRVFSSMLAKADILREQYGEKGVKPLLRMMLKAAAKLAQPETETDEEGNETSVSKGLLLPKKAVKKGDKTTMEELVMGPNALDAELKLQWPPYFEPVISDVVQSVTAAVQAKAGALIDDEHASKFVAPFFRVEDVSSLLERIKKETKERQEEMDALMMGGGGKGGGGGGGKGGGGGMSFDKPISDKDWK
jgi:hypothetical protein